MKPPRPTHLPAAVIEDQNAPVARVVPRGAKPLRDKTGKLSAKLRLGYEHTPARISRRPGIDTLRVAEGERLIRYRHGDGGVDTDGEGEIYIRALAPHILAQPAPHEGPNRVVMGDPLARLIGWASQWCRKALGEIALDDLREIARDPGRTLKADALANRLRLTRAERTALEIRTIGAIDWSKKEREAARREDARIRKAEKRRAEGARSYADTVAKAEPWKAAGVSRRTWFRNQAVARGTTTSTIERAAPGDLGTTTSTTGNEVSGQVGTTTATVRSIASRYCGRSSAIPAQEGDARQLSFLAPPQARDELRAVLDRWHSGEMPEAVRVAVIAAKRRRAFRQEDVATAIGISRPQLANAMHAAERRALGLPNAFDLSPEIIANLKRWLLADDADLPPPAEWDRERAMRPPHHRRGGKRPPDPGPVFPTLRLFSLIEGGAERSRNQVLEPESEAA
ncbi:hypothetical protein [Enterovirga aerilata]|uniref:Uncharacterized protein n=1 Tax=Enterovirga aerilata TaxID=2730920 RepID=A0A849I5Q5_9HYPH|nr:hypothetical protein [Enterovirga sp. DB1703]NNM71430.1 hypothetical protein [Enterovirga sp. DB1703]